MLRRKNVENRKVKACVYVKEEKCRKQGENVKKWG
jgi:hypothetical protein